MDVLTTLMIIGVATVAGETVIRVARARAGGAAPLQAISINSSNGSTIRLQPWRKSSRTWLGRRPSSANSKIDWTLPSGC